MLTAPQRRYLANMGIEIWQTAQNHKTSAQTLIPHHKFLLFSLNDEMVGELLLEIGDIPKNEDTVFALLDAMLKAIRLQRKPYEENAKDESKKLTLLMGESLAQQLLHSQKSLDELRQGNLYPFNSGGILLVTYHPLQLLKQPGDKRKAWLDLQKFSGVLSS